MTNKKAAGLCHRDVYFAAKLLDQSHFMLHVGDVVLGSDAYRSKVDFT